MTTTQSDESGYPASWKPKCAPPEPDPVDERIDDYVRGLSDREFQLLVWRTRRDH